MGGYLAVRAVAFDHCIATCILNADVFNGYYASVSGFPKSLLTAIEW
jgi:hypothetical protein